jgi:hypothetical protein
VWAAVHLNDVERDFQQADFGRHHGQNVHAYCARTEHKFAAFYLRLEFTRKLVQFQLPRGWFLIYLVTCGLRSTDASAVAKEYTSGDRHETHR